MKTPLQPTKPHPQDKRTTPQANTVSRQSNTPSQTAKNSQGNKNKEGSSGCRLTRSERLVKKAPIQEEDSDSHDSYESAKDELYRPPKILGDNLYSSDSDSDIDNRKSGARKDIKSEVRKKHRPPKTILGDKEIEIDDSNYEGSEDEQSSDSDLDEDDEDFEALKATRKVVEGDEIAQYGLVWNYANELLTSNPGSTIQVGVITTSESSLLFDRFYVCLDACKRGFKVSCRPLIELDGVFLKTLHGGQILTACGQYAKNHIFVITYAIVRFNPYSLGGVSKGSPSLLRVVFVAQFLKAVLATHRRRENDEQPTGSKTKMKRKYNPVKSMYCGEIGHNKRGCAKKKVVDAEKHARQMQLQLAVVAPVANGADREVNIVPVEHDNAPEAIAPLPALSSPIQPPTDIDISQSESILPTQDTQQDQVVARPPKLQVIKGKVRATSSPKPTVATPVAISAETIKGTSSVTAKKLANFMTFVPTPGFKHPRKNDKTL
ncbi:hypothetical protein Ahy_A08g039604 [Arachis hypogaea]|uniref:Uncharacterized protein n=1 Tax=Arachis hypogaea TaxID=3818 RepID=A0A445BX85_ARAHY|nr:hypothetical protein Ahy_A08g039604 [Arachis hypogaea]